jgi:tRNA-specific 2-thiouridylase
MGADGIATGHYVRVQHGEPGESCLLRGLDSTKDQAYFLWGLPREVLPFLHFPLGGFTKDQVREMARERDLLTADKPESQEICFVPTGDYTDLLRGRLESSHPAFQPGAFVTLDGEVVGGHPGYAGFTVGQRRGLPGGFPEAMFVLEIRPGRREVVIGPREELLARWVELSGLNWLGEAPKEGERVEIQLRHRARPAGARVDGMGDTVVLELEEAQAAVTPGQSGVIFSGDRVRGGGRIRSSRSPGS